MYPRFGMSHVAIQTAQARTRAAELQRPHDANPAARATGSAHDDEKAVLWRTAAVVAAMVAVVAAIVWLV